MRNITCLINDLLPRLARPARSLAIWPRGPEQAFFGISALLFVVSAAATMLWCNSMSAMPGMDMPGGWTMSMAWMRMPGQTWAGATASFVAMWLVMMAAMMLPSLTLMLYRYGQSLDTTDEILRDRLTALAGLGYFFVWTLIGLAVFPAGAFIARIEMERPALARAVPVTAGIVVLIAGALQFTRWKARHLACCREAPGSDCALPAETGAAWHQGLRFGLHCGLSYANLTAILLVLGVMDLRAMAAVTAGITAERVAPDGEGVARAIGVVVIGLGLLIVMRAVRLP